MKRVLIWSLLAALGSVSVAAQAAAPAKASGPASGVCGELPCANTPGGEDPTEAALKKAAAESKKINDSGSDRQRWEDITLYSEATNPADKSKISVHNKYVRGTDAKSGKPELVCSDLRAPKGEEHGGTCGGGAVPMLKNTLSL